MNMRNLRNILTSMWTWLFIAIGIGGIAYVNMAKEKRLKASTPMPTISIPETPFIATARGKVEIEGGILSLSAARTGTFKEIYVNEGDEVTLGQVLALQEDRDERIKLETAQINLEKARIALTQQKLDKVTRERELERAQIQRDQDAISQQAYDINVDALERSKLVLMSKKIEIKKFETQVETAIFNLAQRKLVAPADGRIITANIKPGTGVTTDSISTAFELMPNAQKLVRVDIDDVTIGKIFVGQGVVISRTSNRSDRFSGTVMRIAEIFSSSGRGGDVIEVVISAGDLPLRVGQPVLVQFEKPNLP